VSERTPLEPGSWLSVKQALALLPISRALLYRLLGEGQLRAIRVASAGSARGRLLVERQSIEEYVERRLTAATTPAQIKLNPDEILARIRRHGGGRDSPARCARGTGGCARRDAPECREP